MKIRLGIKIKLFLTILAAVCAVVIGMHLLMQWSFSRGFQRYLQGLEMQRLAQLAPLLEEHYAAHGGWQDLEGDRRLLRELLYTALLQDDAETRPPRPKRWESMHPERPSSRLERFERRLVFLDAGKRPLPGSPPPAPEIELLTLRQGGETIGFLGLLPRVVPEDRHQKDFLQSQKRAFTLISFAIAGLAALLALPLAHHLVKRIRGLAAGTRSLAEGDFAVRLPVSSSDELGQLARDFNHLALTLGKNELQRRQWVADISHELRTPLAVLRGEIEALQDGVRPLSAEALRSLHGEVQRLTRLVEDLYQLALSDVGALDYRLRDFDAAPLLCEAVEGGRAEAARRGIQLTFSAPDTELPLHADLERIRQLLDNLLGNALKYTDAPGEIVLRCSRVGSMLQVDLYDTPPGVPEVDLGRLFERLYRVEESRSRASGGAGLGLAICRNIVEGHGGAISAHPSPLGGVWIQVQLPLGKETR